MKKIIIIFTILILTMGSDIKGQVTQEWVATYSGVGAGNNVPKKCMSDKFGNIFAAGRSENLSFNDDFIVLKYNSSGNLLWERRYNGIGNGDDAIAAVVLDDSGNIYVTGYSQEGSSLGGYNWMTIKYYSNGDTAWKRSFNWTANSTDEPFAMAIDKFRNIYIAGYGRANQPIDDDFITLKYNSDGELLWTKVYDSRVSGPDRALSIAIDDSANVYPTGYSAFSGGNELITIKYNINGIQQWIRKNPTFNGDYLRPAHVITDKDNNVIVNGYYYIGEHYAFNTIKYTSSGDLLWNRIYKGAGNLNFCFALCTDDSANVYAAGRSQNAVTDADFVTIKYNQFGDTMWIRNYDSGENGNDYANGIAIDKLQNVYLTGRSYYAVSGLDFVTIKYDKEGNLLWSQRYIGIGISSIQDISYSIVLDNSDLPVITGNSDLTTSSNGIVTIKYSQLTEVNPNLLSDNNENLLYQNYPNPFNPITRINYELSRPGEVQIKVYDVLGKEIAELLHDFKNKGKYQITFSGAEYSSGIYFYNLFVDKKLVDTKRMLLIK